MVQDRIAAVNALIKSASGRRRLLVHPRCKHLIKDLTYLAYLEGGREIDKRDPDANHITDALGYPLSYLRPLKYTSGTDTQPQISVGIAT